ncbi:hypothetical protein ACM46_14165 [Chryseobacterium angstadtii]|uniref:EpsG family protein n=1 Tax=Chryseobacterium angstadtii TaxID=558151 RepID=A0A0J7IB52_9FLAO|nr:hypothetical protein [Chryseobacterium angstadtii]KMQ63081.1 hypothetical protein ACM46_14165 [Chryseobacterium angstadtii]
MNRKLLIAFLYVYMLAFSFIKTVRLPNEWSEAHWLMDYRFGFIKRGLAGEVFGFFFEKSLFNIQVLSGTILFLLYAALLTISLRMTFQNYSIRKVLFYGIFFLSQYMVLSAHLIGYLDHFIFLLTILAVYLIKNKKIFLASLVAVFSVVMHEISFFLMIPVCLFAVVVFESSGKNLVFTFGLFRKAGLFLLFPVIATVSVSLYQEVYGKENDQLILHYLENTGLISKRVAVMIASAYTESFGTYLKEQSPYFIERLLLSKNTLKFGLPILFMMYMTIREFRNIDKLILLFLAAVSLFPLLLHAVAWDTFRIWAFPFMILFLGFWILNSRFAAEEASPSLSWPEILLFGISVILVAVFQNNLFENEIERLSKMERCLLLIPVFAGIAWLYLKKAPIKNIEA